MSPPEESLEDLENDVDNLKDSVHDLEDQIKDIDYNIEELRFSKEDYEIYLFPTTIQRYLNNIIEIQQRDEDSFFPSSETSIENYFQQNFPSFDHNNIKYDATDDFSVICKIISDQGRSGSSFIENVDNIIDINKPLLLFYGIEQISAFYSNLHFNFTWENINFNPIRNNFARHGIDASEFKNEIDLENPIEDILGKKIKLKKLGLAQRFFLTIAPDFISYFNDELEISLIDLLKLFFIFSPIPYKTRRIFQDLYGSRDDLSQDLMAFYQSHRQNLNVFLIYLLSFIFCHMCRYKLYAWTLILKSEEKNIGYFIIFFLNYSKNYFIKKVFDKVDENAQNVKRWLKYGSSNMLLI